MSDTISLRGAVHTSQRHDSAHKHVTGTAVYADDEDPSIVHHAQLVRDGNMVMLATAADSFGKGDVDVELKPSGAREVRQAANAFLLMRERILRQIEQRTQMLAGVSHDLRTPLTRMKLELALMPPGPTRRTCATT